MLKFLCFGGAHVQSALDEFTITTDDSCPPIPPRELYNALGMLQADTWGDGTTTETPIKIDGHMVMVRREGWRLRVWGVDAEPQPAEPLPPPADAHTGPRGPARITPARDVLFPDDAKPGTVPPSVQAFVDALAVAREFVPQDAGYDAIRAEVERLAALANNPSDDAPSMGFSLSSNLMQHAGPLLDRHRLELERVRKAVERALDVASMMEHPRRIDVVRDVVALQRHVDTEVGRCRVALRRHRFVREVDLILEALNVLQQVVIYRLFVPYLTELKARLLDANQWTCTHRPDHAEHALRLSADARDAVGRLHTLASSVVAEWAELFSLLPWEAMGTGNGLEIHRNAVAWVVGTCETWLQREALPETPAAPPSATPGAGEDDAIRRELKGAVLFADRALEWVRRACDLDGRASSSLVYASPVEARVVVLDLRNALRELYATRWTALDDKTPPLPFSPASPRAALVFARGELAECVLAWAEYPGQVPDLVQRAQRLMEAALIRLDGFAFAMHEQPPALTDHERREAHTAVDALNDAAELVQAAVDLERDDLCDAAQNALERILAARVVVIDDVLQGSVPGDLSSTRRKPVSLDPRDSLVTAHRRLTTWLELHVEYPMDRQDPPEAVTRAMLHALVMVDRALLAQPARPSVRRTLGRLLGRLASAVSP